MMTPCERCGQNFAQEALFCPMCGAPRARLDGDPLMGTIVADRYLLRERLGQGGSGSIYLAEHVMLRRRVAIKILHHELSRDDLAVERFRREATTVGEIDNEHIVEVLDFGRAADGRLFLAMELLEGETLSDTLKRERRLPIAQVVDILAQLGEALMEAHAMGYVHRDLRPRNVFLARRRGREGFVKLLDFGLAKLVEREGEAASTSLGMTFGDPRYMSPEQARGEPVDRRADIYSLGVMAYELLIGEPPFVGTRVFDVLTKHLEEPPPRPSQARADVPHWLDAVIVRMLAKQPAERFVTVYRLVEALREGEQRGAVMTDEVARTTPVVVPPPPAPRSRELPAPEGTRNTAVVRGIPVAAVADAVAEAKAATANPNASSNGAAAGSSSSAMGMSGAWYADGEAAAEAAGTSADDLDLASDRAKTVKRAPSKPVAKKAAAASTAGASNWDEPVYADDEAARKKKLMIVGGAIGALFLGVLVIAFWPTGKQAAAVIVPDAAVVADEPSPPPDAAPPAPVDAGVIAKKPDPRPRPRPVGDDPIVVPARRPDAGVEEPPSANAAQADFYVKLGRQALSKGDALGAATNFNKAREFDPRNADAIAGMGEVALQQGSYEDAVVHLEAAVRLAPRSVRILNLLGNAYLGAGKAKQAGATFKRVLKIDPNNAIAKRGHAEAVAQGG